MTEKKTAVIDNNLNIDKDYLVCLESRISELESLLKEEEGEEDRDNKCNNSNEKPQTAPTVNMDEEVSEEADNANDDGYKDDIETLMEEEADSCGRKKSKTDEFDAECHKLPFDTYSFIIADVTCSAPFLLGIFVFCFQTAVFSLVLFNVVNQGEQFAMPSNVPAEVRVTQLVAIIIALVTQDDIRTGLVMMNDGYMKDNMSLSFPEVSGWKWVVSIMARIFTGGMGLIVTFFLIMTEDTVRDLLLNFTAMQFVSQLDEVFFHMSCTGYTGVKASSLAHKVVTKHYRTARTSEGSSFKYRNLLFFFMFVVTCIFWMQVSSEQARGDFLCNTLLIQFDDGFLPTLGRFSGLYEMKTVSQSIFSTQRVEFVEKRSGRAKFAYCSQMDVRAWTFTWEDDEGNIDPCNWKAMSEPTLSFDLQTTISSSWVVRNSEDRVINLNHFYMSCYDCNTGQKCGGHGTCENKICSCDQGWYGLRCEFREPCPTLGFDSRYGPFSTNHEWSEQFQRFVFDNQPVDVYYRPVYINEYSPGLFDIILFTGRRWIATYSPLLPRLSSLGRDSQIVKQALARFLQTSYHAYFNDIEFVVVSDPLDFGTSRDMNPPQFVGWHVVNSSLLSSTLFNPSDAPESSLLCTVCGETNTCMYDGKCVNGLCECSVGASGSLCQIPPVGNGRCDKFYNTLGFENDGGDCCESTCVSSAQFTCGRDGFANHGYFFCNLPSKGWRISGETISGSHGSLTGYAVGLGDNGNVLAVAGTRNGRVRIFDKDGSKWVRRGEDLEGSSDIFFGNSIALSGDSRGLVNNPMSITPIVLAIGTTSTRNGYVYIHECGVMDCAQETKELVAFRHKNRMRLVLDMDSTGFVIVVGVAPTVNEDFIGFNASRIIFFHRSSYMEDFVKTNFDFNFGDTEGVYSVSLSSLGDILVVGTFTTAVSAQGVQHIIHNINRAFARTENGWEQRGKTIVTEAQPALMFNMQGRSIAVAGNGMVFASGMWVAEDGSHGVLVVRWDDGQSDWVQQGSVLMCGDYESQGWAVSLSSDGSIVALASADRNDEASVMPGVRLNGTVCTFQWNGTEWEQQLGDLIRGGHSSSIALSSSGSTLAVGLPFHDLSRVGLTSVYEYPNAKPVNGTSSLVRVSVTTDDRPQSTSWELFLNDTGESVLEGGPYGSRLFLSTFVNEAIIPFDSCVIFTIYDNLDLDSDIVPDGIRPPGSHVLYVDGEEVVSGTIADAAERVYIGDNCLQCPTSSTTSSHGHVLFQLMIQTCIPIAWELIDNKSWRRIVANDNIAQYGNTNHEDCTFAHQTTHWEDVCLSTTTTTTTSNSSSSNNNTDNDFCISFQLTPYQPFENNNNNNKNIPTTTMMTPTTRSGHNVQYRVFANKEEIAQDRIRFLSSSSTSTTIEKEVFSIQVGNCLS